MTNYYDWNNMLANNEEVTFTIRAKEIGKAYGLLKHHVAVSMKKDQHSKECESEIKDSENG